MDGEGDKEHKYKAIDVTGVMGGTLMCEVRRSNRDENSMTNTGRPNRRPELNTNDELTKKEWMVVRRKGGGNQR